MKRVVGLFLIMISVAVVQAQEVKLEEAAFDVALVEPVGPPKPVVVVNELTQPVPVTGAVQARDPDNPARQPFQAFLRTIDPPYVVPQGKRLVIEYVSGSLGGSLNCAVTMGLLRTTVLVDGNKVSLSHFLPAAERPSPLGAVLGQLTRIYADPGTEVIGNVETDPNNCGASFIMSLSGYLVDVP